jgi:murein DD-endopeptidase MepM/ murein hydrolase activator NlpD
MRKWPIPDSFSKKVPEKGEPGSFWKNRGDRHHCGVDIYAPCGSNVVAVENGVVIDSGLFTSPDFVPYWHKTYFVIVKHMDGLVCKYAEMGNIEVKTGDMIAAGQVIGSVGDVLNPDKITTESPSYIQDLKKNGIQSMLHIELYQGMPGKRDDYLGGNLFSHVKPENLLDPTEYFNSFTTKERTEHKEKDYMS